jgi:metal-responsive CopG/Arc/MetJ family transcriptional regulator
MGKAFGRVVTLNCDERLLAELDDFTRKLRVTDPSRVYTRSDAIRVLLRLALDASRKESPTCDPPPQTPK